MLHNVRGWRRFASPNKGLRSKTRAGKMWWSKIVQRALAPTRFCGTRDAERRRSANRLLCDVPVFSNSFPILLIYLPIYTLDLFLLCPISNSLIQFLLIQDKFYLYLLTHFQLIFSHIHFHLFYILIIF